MSPTNKIVFNPKLIINLRELLKKSTVMRLTLDLDLKELMLTKDLNLTLLLRVLISTKVCPRLHTHKITGLSKSISLQRLDLHQRE